jgi:deoxyribodipyrimidine photolyase-related protein
MSLLILPTQLFADIRYIKTGGMNKVYLYEEPKFFTAFKYHKLKLLYHRLSCKLYAKWLTKSGINCTYVDYDHAPPTKITHFIDPIDHELEAKYKKRYHGATMLATQHFTLTREEAKKGACNYMSKNGRFSHEQFYKWQRRRLNILMRNGQPEGGRWSFDTENRQSMPVSERLPAIQFPKLSGVDAAEFTAAKQYITKHFANNYGELPATNAALYPSTHAAAHKWLDEFVKHRLKKFGKYEDASRAGEIFLYHSALTPMLNIGLLTDWDVLAAVQKHRRGVPLPSLEGFIRQLIGWRNYMYCIYLLKPDIAKQNFFKARRHLNVKKWWTGTTGIDPLDDIIQNKIVKYAYAHHIERLMYLGAFMMMLDITPKAVYQIFMEWTIDAYEWVMVPNIYGMSQFADGGQVMRRPYFSSSNYIRNMSNYKRGEWCGKWDAVYYAFLDRHKKFFAKNYFYAGQIVNWNNKTPTEKATMRQLASELAKKITST